ncbi:uncharacterized protein LOC121372324 [Gigantopelta aegis]|uniref:uncharacterized protein LOC121372324 n=1 Tax=Gigantopelta aegis TaxID=1735272 RepID=UPI001B88A877|nr:uncharacterized protein LOC121372324 [Gigantopelta aegis]
MKEYHNFEENSFMTETNGTVYIRIAIPELTVQKCLQFQLDDTVWQAKQRILQAFAKDLRDPLNYGLYLPPTNGRAGKFLDEERVLQEYPLQGPIGFLEFKYKRRVYKVMQINPRKLKQLHTKSNLKSFLECVRSGNIDKINKSTSKGLDPNFHDQDSGETPLTIAVTLGRDKCRDAIISLISGGAHIDFRNKQGLSPMHRAAIVGSMEAVKALLDLGASPNYKDARGLTPIYYCVSNDTNPLCAEILLHERSQINIQDEQGWFEIHQACRYGRVQHLEHLLYYGADIDVQNASGNTPLHVCAINNQESCARVLLFRGANKNVVNYNNQSAYEVAIIASNFELAEIIKAYKSEDAVPYREIPKYSERRKLSAMTPSIRALVRSRSDPRLNISAIDDQFTQSTMSLHPGELYGSYSPSREYNSDSPRSLSISSTSSGPVLSVGDHGYYEGRVENREGWFPSNNVQEVRMRRAGSHGDNGDIFYLPFTLCSPFRGSTMSQRAIRKRSVEKARQAVDPPRAKTPLFPINKFITLPNGIRPGKAASGDNSGVPVTTLPHKAGMPIKVVHLKYDCVESDTQRRQQAAAHLTHGQGVVSASIHPGGLRLTATAKLSEDQFKGRQQRVNTAVSGSHVSTVVQRTSQSKGAAVSARRYYKDSCRESPSEVQRVSLSPPPLNTNNYCLSATEYTPVQVNGDVGCSRVAAGGVLYNGDYCGVDQLCTPPVFDHWHGHDARNGASRSPVGYSQPHPLHIVPANGININSHLEEVTATTSWKGVTHSGTDIVLVCKENNNVIVAGGGKKNGRPADKYVIRKASEPNSNRCIMMGNYYDPHDFYGEGRRMNMLQSKARFSSMPSLFTNKDMDYKKALKLEKKREKEERKRLEKEEKKRRKAEKKYASLNIKTLPKNWNYVTRPIEEVYLRPRMRLTAVPIDFEDGPVTSHSPPSIPPPPPPGVRMQRRALHSSAPDLLRIQQVYGTLSRETRNHQYTLPKTEYAPRTVILQKGSEGFGFVLRGAKSQTRAANLDFQPTPEFPALQYLDSVDVGSQADRVGLKSGDFLLEINDENVVRASHERVVQLIRSSRDRLKMKVVTVRPLEKDNDWFIHQDGAMTLPNRIKRLAPAPPKRDPQTSLSYSKGTSRSMADGMEEIAKLDQIVAEFEGQTIAQRPPVMNNVPGEPKIASVRAAHAAKRMSVVDLDNIMVKDDSSSKGKEYKSPSELRIQKYHKKHNGIMERSKSTPDLVAEIEAGHHGENIYAKANIQTGAGNVVYKQNGGVWNRSPTAAHKDGSPRSGMRTVSYAGSVQKPPVYMDPSALHAGVYSGSYAKVYEEPKYMIPAVPGRNPIPKRPAPPPPSKGEVVSINTTASSNGIYANVSEEIQVRKKEESPYESSFRPGTLARLSKHPQVLTNSLEQAKLKSHQRSASLGNIDMPNDDDGKPSVSFAEDKVFQNAASFIQKHPNATLLVTADVYKAQNKSGKYYEPEPDYDDPSDEDRRLHAQLSNRAQQSSNSSTSSQRSSVARSERKMSSDSSGTVTVISIKADQLKKDSPLSNKRYTIHSDIPSSISALQSEREASKIIIPPRPNEPAPLPPAVPSSSDSSRRSSLQSNFSGDRDNSSEKITAMYPAYYNQNSNNKYKSTSSTDRVHNSSSSSISTTKSSPSVVHKPPPESAPPPPPPPPPAPPAAPPPPPLPSTDPPQLKNQNDKPQPLIPQVSSLDIMAAVAKRQVRLDTEGPRMTEEKPAPPKDPVKEKLTMNQEALKAAVERRKNILNKNADTAVVESIEARLQKTKKLQAAKYFFSSDTMKRGGGTNNDTVEAESKQEAKKEEGDAKVEGQVKSVFSSSTLKSAKTSKASSVSNDVPKSTKSVPAPVPVKTTAVQKSPPKPAAKVEKAASQPSSPNTGKTKSESQPSDFLALAEKRRQEYLKKKSSKDDGGTASTLPRAKQSSSASKASPSNHHGKTIEVLPAKQTSNGDHSKLAKQGSSDDDRDTKISIKDRIAKLEKRKKENMEVIGVTEDHSHTDGGSTLHRKGHHTNGYGFVAPPPGFGDSSGQTARDGVVQIDIIPPPAHFANESSTDEGVHSGDQGGSSAFGHDDAASQVSSVSTISTLSSEPGEGGGASRTNRSYEIAPPPPPGFDDSTDPTYEEIQGSGFIPPPPEFGSGSQDASNKNKPMRPFQTKPVDSWLCTDVMDWLDSLNMSQYKAGFAKNCIDGPKLQGLGRNDYIELGVVQVGHRMNLERSIKKVAMGKSSAEVVRL